MYWRNGMSVHCRSDTGDWLIVAHRGETCRRFKTPPYLPGGMGVPGNVLYAEASLGRKPIETPA